MKSFWEKLPKPFFCLAPMADVTDCAFRAIIAHHSDSAIPRVLWTEFVSADGLCHPKARAKLLIDLQYSPGEHPIVAQLFTSNPANMTEAARLCRDLGFDGIDINMGCPDRTIEKQGAGAALIKNPNAAQQVIEAARHGAGNIPVSVKTRIGYSKIDMDWIKFLLEQKLPVITVHLRTRKEMSRVAAHWDLMPEILKLRDALSPGTLIIGNGDIRNIGHARERAKQYGCDGIMLGRAIFGTPELFSETTFPLDVKLRIMVEHTKMFETLLGGTKSFAIMKKHYKAYAAGFPGSHELRRKLMECQNAAAVTTVVEQWIATNANLDKTTSYE